MKFCCTNKYLCRGIPYFIIGLFTTISVRGPSGQFILPLVTAQPFINSLAVLFRARPPWPTTFPSSNHGNSGTFHVFSNSIPKNSPGPIPAPLLSSAASQQGILVAHPIPAKSHSHSVSSKPHSHPISLKPHTQLYPNHFRKPPLNPHRLNSGTHSKHPHPIRPQFLLDRKPPTHMMNSPNNHQPPLGSSSSTAAGSFRFPDIPSPPQLQSMTEGDSIPPRIHYNYNWQSNKEIQTNESSGQKRLEFRPSPQLLEFPSLGLTNSHELVEGKLTSQFQAAEGKRLPRYESGFQPITFSHHQQYGYNTGGISMATMATSTSVPFHYENSHQNYYNPWSADLNPKHDSIIETTTSKPLVVQHDPYYIVKNAEVSKSVVTTDFSIEEVKSSESSVGDYGTKFTSSSERMEDWISAQPVKISKSINSVEKFKFPVYKKRVRPIKCEKFHRYGFCPVTSNYPLVEVEKIAERCSALLSHLITPLPKTNAHYDILVTRNGSFKGKSATTRRPGNKAWSWKNYRGKPVCDTKEIKIVPGWAKNKDGDWLVILQTQVWKQDVQVSICSPPGSSNKCNGVSCEKGLIGNSRNTKCVQRFTAQRLSVLDPESQNRCPVMRSVFLPSACVCLSDDDSLEQHNISHSMESHEVVQDSLFAVHSDNIPIVLPPSLQNMNDTTFMIVSEKYSTNESAGVSHELL